MKTSSFVARVLFFGILALGYAFSAPVFAHQVGGVNGIVDHQHVYKRNAYGSPATAGHVAQPAGSRGIVIWQASPSRAYGKARSGFRVPRNVPPQPSQKQIFQQKPTFSKDQRRTPGFNRK